LLKHGFPAQSGDTDQSKTAFATVTFDDRAEKLPKAAVDRVVAVARSARASNLRIELGGRAIEEANRPSLGAATAIALVAALIVLLATFGSLVAAGLPLITALLGLGTALGVIGVLTKLIDVPDFSTQLAALLGLGLGIDYALFIVTRFRENHRSGHDLETAIERAMDTAGRAVLFAGITVMIALLGMVALGVTLLDAAALASAMAVALTMLARLRSPRWGRSSGVKELREAPRLAAANVGPAARCGHDGLGMNQCWRGCAGTVRGR
jgi:putative drug exporter of the RND superfamily